MLPIKKKYQDKKREKRYVVRNGGGEERQSGEAEEARVVQNQVKVTATDDRQGLGSEHQGNRTLRSSSGPNQQPPEEKLIGLEGFNADDELRKIAENGRDWKLRHLRQGDMEVYLFRLLIEWARITEPDSPPPSPPSTSPPPPPPPSSLTPPPATAASTEPSRA